MKTSHSQSVFKFIGLGANSGKQIRIVAYKSKLGITDSLSDTGFDLSTKYTLMSIEFNTLFRLAPVRFSLRQGFEYSIQQISDESVISGFDAFVGDAMDGTIYKCTPSVLQPWHDSLSVKPSSGLWSDLKTLADGTALDGDWDEMDLFGMVAAMETDEQRLRPLKTTSGDDCIIEGSPGLSVNGIDCPLQDISGLNLKWNPTDDGVKYTLNSAYIGGFGRTKISNILSSVLIGSLYEPVSNERYWSSLSIDSTTTSMTSLTDSYINSGASLTQSGKSGLANLAKTFFVSAKRVDSTNSIRHTNGSVSSNQLSPTSFLPTLDFGYLGRYTQFAGEPSVTFDTLSTNDFYGRGYICGSSLINHDRVANRLRTFFIARGLPMDNY